MLNSYFDKTFLSSPPPMCFSFSQSLVEMTGDSKMYDHMTIIVYSCPDIGGGSTYPTGTSYPTASKRLTIMMLSHTYKGKTTNFLQKM